MNKKQFFNFMVWISIDGPLSGRDEFELEFSGSSEPELWRFRAELGHFNFRAETELTILTIFVSKNLIFFYKFPNFAPVSWFQSISWSFIWIYIAQKVFIEQTVSCEFKFAHVHAHSHVCNVRAKSIMKCVCHVRACSPFSAVRCGIAL